MCISEKNGILSQSLRICIANHNQEQPNKTELYDGEIIAHNTPPKNNNKIMNKTAKISCSN